MNKEQIESAATEYIHRDKTHGLTRKKAFKDDAPTTPDSVELGVKGGNQ